ncbi:aldo/keto reductase [Fulvivirga lutea]|uniref:Aldo/keto reductase n=1 Tax=Fulvivirga lutea TaxID=2810512 RepID=A0A974WGN3_9BACT|nr:aldo/keto reductase [Fulvivirga lutea]QSE97328.1 aldo/keto reductase [Fulvivirga lutea]
MDRRNAVKLISAAGAGLSLGFKSFDLDTSNIRARAIGTTNEMLPVVGLGTWQTFDVGSNSTERDALTQVLRELRNYGGSVVDSSPMYGRSEEVVGELSAKLGITNELFMATKVWTSGKQSGINQMNQSMQLMKKPKMDLMQIHNLLDWQTHIKTLKDWKEQGRIRYIGITHYVSSAFSKMESIMKSEPIDFIQLNYSIDSREAENSILPLAKERGISVLINRPYGGGSLFHKVKGKQVPDWAQEFDCDSWGQFFLKYLLSNEAVTCAIPGTSKPHHMVDNLKAGLGRLPSAKMRGRMIELVGSL